VPRSAKMNQDVSDHIADEGQLNLAPEVVTRRTTVRAGKRDTVESIAHRYRLSAVQVADWNNTSAAAAFKPGQHVVLFLPVRSRVHVPNRMVRTASTAAPGRKGHHAHHAAHHGKAKHHR
jgi:membrane-bound lytic murein transglycosylase D